MVAIVLLAIAASAIGIRTSQALEKRRFQTAAGRLFSELEACRQLAMNMQADWNLEVQKKNGRLVLLRTSAEVSESVAHEWKAEGDLLWNHEPVERIAFLFSSTGKIVPKGRLEMICGKIKIQWDVPQVFALQEGTDGAIPRPTK